MNKNEIKVALRCCSAVSKRVCGKVETSDL